MESLKRELLLFDEVEVEETLASAFLEIDVRVHALNSSLHRQADAHYLQALRRLMAELEFLSAHGLVIISPLEKIINSVAALDGHIAASEREAAHIQDCLDKLQQIADDNITVGDLKFWNGLVDKLAAVNESAVSTEQKIQTFLAIREQMLPVLSTVQALFSTALPLSDSNSLFIADSFEYHNIRDRSRFNKADVLNIILDKFPTPLDTVAWEQIIDFRNDSEYQRSLHDLRRWINRSAMQMVSVREIEQEIDHLLNRFEYLMDRHRMKYNYCRIENAVAVPLEILTDIVKLNWGKVARAPFAFKRAGIDYLLEQEKVEGREIRYISQVNKEFGAGR